LLGACSSTPTTHMIVPSRDTVQKIEALNRRTDLIADVLTTDRTEHWLKLDGAGGPAISGRDMMLDNANESLENQVVKIPLDQSALIYYQKVSGKPAAGSSLPTKSDYPSLPAADPQDRELSCDQLDLELSRAETIRWYARKSGADPFTTHSARVQHAKKAAQGALIVMAIPMLAALIVADPLRTLPYWHAAPPRAPSLESLRWAVTAADRREIGLLEIKRARSCPAQALPGSETTDLDLLNQIESSRVSLAAHSISDQEQINQQTKLLDQLDPPALATTRVASATDFTGGGGGGGTPPPSSPPQ